MVSIITPTLNQAATLEETIESVLRQGHPQVEHLIFDGGSTDGTLDILHRYDGNPRVRWFSEPDRGQSHAINKGLALCRGDIFNWLNSDDYLQEDALSQVAQAFADQPEADIISGYTNEFHDDTGQIFNRSKLQIRRTREETLTVGVYCQVSTFWKTAVVRSLGGVREDLHFCMDTDLWMRYLLTHGQRRVRKLETALAFYRHHDGSKTRRCSAEFYRETDLLYDRLHERLKAPAYFIFRNLPKADLNLPPLAVASTFNRNRYFGSYCERRVRISRCCNLQEARRWLVRSFSYFPWASLWRLKMIWRLFLRRTS